MRKVDGVARLQIMVPLILSVDYTIRANEGANIQKVLERHLKGKKHALGDVEYLEVSDAEPVQLCGYDVSEELDTALSQSLENGTFDLILDMNVEDSR